MASPVGRHQDHRHRLLTGQRLARRDLQGDLRGDLQRRRKVPDQRRRLLFVAYRRAFAGHRGRYQPERPSTPTARSPRPAARTGRRTPTRSPFPRAATFTTPSPSTASPGAATPGTASATTCTSATSASKKISKRLLYAVFSFCRKKRPARRPGWNSLDIKQNDGLFQNIEPEPYVYFVHSYYLGFCRSVKKSTGIQTW